MHVYDVCIQMFKMMFILIIILDCSLLWCCIWIVILVLNYFIVWVVYTSYIYINVIRVNTLLFID
jgi:hypothetical protein